MGYVIFFFNRPQRKDVARAPSRQGEAIFYAQLQRTHDVRAPNRHSRVVYAYFFVSSARAKRLARASYKRHGANGPPARPSRKGAFLRFSPVGFRGIAITRAA